MRPGPGSRIKTITSRRWRKRQGYSLNNRDSSAGDFPCGNNMKKTDRIQSLLWALFGFYIAFEGYRLKLGTPRAPKPGFLIFWMGIIILILSLLFFLQSFSASQDEKKIRWKGLQWQRGIKLLVALFLYVAVFQWLGFILSTFFLLLFLFKGLEPQRWRTALILSAVTVTVCYLVFGVFLELQFPPGLLRAILA
jgi:putative tricarboxylic transport membrane protein